MAVSHMGHGTTNIGYNSNSDLTASNRSICWVVKITCKEKPVLVNASNNNIK
jgi:hypothetical protein